MTDRLYSHEEVQDRFAIMDLYDRQLAAAEAFEHFVSELPRSGFAFQFFIGTDRVRRHGKCRRE